MNKFTSAVKNFVADENGVTAIEYVILAAALATGLTLAFGDVGTTLITKLNAVLTKI